MALSLPPEAAHRNVLSRGGLGRGPQSEQPSGHQYTFQRSESVQSLYSRGRGEGTRGFSSPGTRGLSKKGSGRQSLTLEGGGEAGNRREAVGLCGCPVSRGAQPYPPPPPLTPRYRPSPSRTHQLLQVLLRELRVAVPLLLELVAGGFCHHHHPRRAEAAVGAATAARQLARLPVPQVPPAVHARAPQSRPATRHAPAAAQEEAPVASHGPPGCGCRLALPAASTTPGAQRLSAGTCVGSATSGETCPDTGAGGEPPRRPEGGGGGGRGTGLAYGWWVLFVYPFPSCACALASRPGPTSLSTLGVLSVPAPRPEPSANQSLGRFGSPRGCRNWLWLREGRNSIWRLSCLRKSSWNRSKAAQGELTEF